MDRPIDARQASWLTISPPATVGYHLSCGMSLPEKEELPHGLGPRWQPRALAAVLRECYVRRLWNCTLEEVEAAAISVLPAPEQDEDERPTAPSAPRLNARQNWERAISVTARAAHRVLRYGPASGSAGGEVLFTGGLLEAEVGGVRLEQRVDLVWRRADGALEAVLVFEEAMGRRGLRPAEADWRCVLAAAVVRSLYGETPDLHTLWVSEAAARVARIPDEGIWRRLSRLKLALGVARRFRGLAETGQSIFYRLREEADDGSGDVSRRRRRLSGTPDLPGRG